MHDERARRHRRLSRRRTDDLDAAPNVGRKTVRCTTVRRSLARERDSVVRGHRHLRGTGRWHRGLPARREGRPHVGGRRHRRRRLARIRVWRRRRPALATAASQARDPVRRRRGRDRGRATGRDRVERRPRDGDRPALARRHDERVQPARQHGRARGDARRDRRHLLRHRRCDDPLGRPAARRLTLPCARGRRLPAIQLPAEEARGGLHGRFGKPGDRAHPRLTRPADELEGGGDDDRDADPAVARARRAAP